MQGVNDTESNYFSYLIVPWSWVMADLKTISKTAIFRDFLILASYH